MLLLVENCKHFIGRVELPDRGIGAGYVGKVSHEGAKTRRILDSRFTIYEWFVRLGERRNLSADRQDRKSPILNHKSQRLSRGGGGMGRFFFAGVGGEERNHPQSPDFLVSFFRGSHRVSLTGRRPQLFDENAAELEEGRSPFSVLAITMML